MTEVVVSVDFRAHFLLEFLRPFGRDSADLYVDFFVSILSRYLFGLLFSR